MPLIVTLEEPVNSKYNSIMKICVKKTIIPQKGVRGIPFLILFTLKIELKKKNAIARLYIELRLFCDEADLIITRNEKQTLNMQLSFTTTSEWLIMLKLYNT